MRNFLILTILLISFNINAQTIGIGGELSKKSYGLQASISWFNISYQTNGFGSIGTIWRVKSRNICKEINDNGDFLLGFNLGTNFKKPNNTFRPLKGLGVTVGYDTNFNIAFTTKANLQNGISLGIMITFNE